MQNQIDTLRQLNYELIKNLGLFRQRAGLSFGQRHTLYHVYIIFYMPTNICIIHVISHIQIIF